MPTWKSWKNPTPHPLVVHWLLTWGMVLFVKLSIGLICWQIWHSARALNWSAFESSRSWCQAHTQCSFPLPWPLSSCANWAMREMSRERLAVHRTGYLIYWITELLLSWSHFLMSIYMVQSIFTSFTHLKRSPHILLQISFSPISTNKLATAYGSVNNHTSHFKRSGLKFHLPT